MLDTEDNNEGENNDAGEDARAALENAWDLSADDTEEEGESTGDDGDSGDDESAEGGADGSAGGTDGEEEEESGEADDGDESSTGEDGDDATAAESGSDEGDDGEGQQEAVEDPPPRSWNAEGREMWKDLPADAKKYLAVREQQIAAGLEKHRQNAQRAMAMDQTLQPFQQLFSMNGGAQPVIQGLLQVGSTLQMGTPQQKAETIANIIQRFGVDVPALDDILTARAGNGEGGGDGGGGNNAAITAAVSQAVAPLQQQVQRLTQGQRDDAAADQAAAAERFEAFTQDPKNEFYTDVRHDMADLLDMAVRRGQPMTLEQAYAKACKMNDKVSAIIAKRNASKAPAKKKKASKSVSSPPAGPGAKPESGKNMTDDIRNAWAAVSSGDR